MTDSDIKIIDSCRTTTVHSPVCESREVPFGGPAEHFKPISFEVTRILDEIRSAVLRNSEEAKPAALRLITLLNSRESGDIRNDRGGLAPWQKRKIVQYIRGNLDRPLKASALAGQVSLSEGHFNRAFRESFGESPHAYIIGLRLQAAEEMMLSTADPLSQIAYACGFADQSHLSRAFRSAVGQSPNAWRRNNIHAHVTGIS